MECHFVSEFMTTLLIMKLFLKWGRASFKMLHVG